MRQITCIDFCLAFDTDIWNKDKLEDAIWTYVGNLAHCFIISNKSRDQSKEAAPK